MRAARRAFPHASRVFLVVAMMLIFDIVVPDYSRLVAPSNAATAGTGICTQTVGDAANVVVTNSGNTCTVRFNASTTWTAPTGISSISVLVVGGGGGGGGGSRASNDGARGAGGGGGGGSVHFKTSASITGGTQFNVSVGAGGGGGSANNNAGGFGSSGSNGGQSSLTASGFTSITASGGFAGTAQTGSSNEADHGGDGGGSSSIIDAVTTSRSGGLNHYEGGGGGAGSGANGTNGRDIGGRGGHGGNGGSGALVTIGAVQDRFGGGGGGGATSGDTETGITGTGGTGGGGRGGVDTTSPIAGTTNAGGGGGGGGGARLNGSTLVYNASNGASGGSGTVVIAYTESVPTLSSGTINSTGTQISLTFSEPISTTTANVGSFAVLNAGIANPVTSVSVSGATLVLNLREPVYKDQSLSVTYTDPSSGDDTNTIQDNVGQDVATFTQSITTTGITDSVPRAARLIGLGTRTVVNLSTDGGYIRGITSDGNKVYFRLSNDYSKIWEVNLDSITETPGGSVTVTPTSWSITNAPSGAEATQLVYSSGCLFVLDASGVLKCIDVSSRSASTVTVPAVKPFPPGQGWLTGNIIGFPDGRIGKVGVPGSGGTASQTLLRIYSVSGTGSNATLAHSEDMILGDITSSWPGDDHGAVSDGTYLYRTRHTGGYKVWRLRSGEGVESVIAFNGDGTGTCAGSGTLCPISEGTFSNATYIGRDNYWGRLFVGDFGASRFYMTEGTTAKITVTYNTDGGSPVASGTTVADASISTAPASPTKTGHTFAGWYTASTGGSEVSFPYAHGRTSNFTLFARWTANTYTVSYDVQGGESVSSTDWSYGSPLTLPTPTRPGYEFAGWSTTAAGSQLVYQTTNPTRNGSGLIQYTSGYGKGASDAAVTLANTPFNRIRYRMEVTYGEVLRYADVSFDAWSGVTLADLAVPDIGDQRLVKRNVTNMAVNSNWRGQNNFATGVFNGAGKSGRLELWARNYAPDTSGVTPVGNGAIYDNDDTQSDGGNYGSFQVHNITSGQEQTVLAWNQHGVVSPDIGMGSNLVAESPGVVHSDWTFRAASSMGKANWKMQIFIGDLRTAGSSYAPTNTAPFTMYAQWVPTTSTVTYNYNNATSGTSTASSTWTTGDSAITLPSPQRTGFEFAGWYSNLGLTSSIGGAGDAYAPSGSITAYAKWLRQLTVTYNSQGGSSFSSGATLEEGSLSSSPGTPTRESFDFKGWYTASSGGTLVTFPYTHGRTQDFTLYAQWITNQAAFSVTGAPAQLAYQSTMTLGTNGGSGTGGIVFATTSPSVCSINANTGLVSMLVASGNCNVVATKAGDADFYATSANVTIPATKANQATLTIQGVTSGTYGGSVTLSVAGGSTNGEVTWSDNSSSVCTINTAGVVSITAGSGGSCIVTATMAGNSEYLDAVSSNFTITVSKATQAAVTVTTTEATFNRPLTLSATGGSGNGAMTWEEVSGTCSVSNGILTPGNAGSSCVIRAKKLTDANYLERSSANTTITINRASQTGFSITSSSTFTAETSLSLTSAGGQSTGVVSWSLVSGQCSLVGSTITASRGGISCVVEATKPGNTNYFDASDTMTVTVEKVTQVLTFVSTPPSPAIVGATYTVNVSSSASLAATLAVTNQSSSVCSLFAGVITFNAEGTCVVSASQSGNDVYSAAAASQSITVVVAPPTAESSSNSSTSQSPGQSVTSPTTTVPSGTANATRAPVLTTTTTTTTTIHADPSRPQLDPDGSSPEIEAGEATAMVRGEMVTVRIEREADAIVLTLPNNVKVRFGRTQPGADTVAIAADGVLRMYPEESVEVVVTGLIPGTTYTVFMFSEPVELGRGEVSLDGSIATAVEVPRGTGVGDHTIQVNGVGIGGEVVSLSMGFEVVEREDNTLIVVLALSAGVLLALLGGRPIFVRRRRARLS